MERNMATINWEELLAGADDYGKNILEVVKPFAPALAREGPDIYEGFIRHLYDQDFEAIDALMYAKMTPEERRKLEDEVLKGAMDAARAKFRQRKLVKEIMFKVLLRVLIMAAVG
jgi:hypothetical protein